MDLEWAYNLRVMCDDVTVVSAPIYPNETPIWKLDTFLARYLELKT